MAKTASPKPPKPEPPTAAENVEAFTALMRERAAIRRQYMPHAAKQFQGKRNRALEEAFLDGLRGGWSIASSAEAIGVSRSTPLAWRQGSRATQREDGTYADDFCLRWEDAVDTGVDKLEDEAERRGVHGVEKPIYQGGQLVGTVTEYSDTLLQVLMKGKRPDRYNVDRVEHTGRDGGKIVTCLEVEFVEHKGKK